jgi:hypothetical protein
LQLGALLLSKKRPLAALITNDRQETSKMTKGKKFDFRVEQDNSTWTAQIVRRKTARETIVSKSQDGFATEEEATQWAQTELKSFLENLVKRNKRRSN